MQVTRWLCILVVNRAPNKETGSVEMCKGRYRKHPNPLDEICVCSNTTSDMFKRRCIAFNRFQCCLCVAHSFIYTCIGIPYRLSLVNLERPWEPWEPKKVQIEIDARYLHAKGALTGLNYLSTILVHSVLGLLNVLICCTRFCLFRICSCLHHRS